METGGTIRNIVLICDLLTSIDDKLGKLVEAEAAATVVHDDVVVGDLTPRAGDFDAVSRPSHAVPGCEQDMIARVPYYCNCSKPGCKGLAY